MTKKKVRKLFHPCAIHRETPRRWRVTTWIAHPEQTVKAIGRPAVRLGKRVVRFDGRGRTLLVATEACISAIRVELGG